jgi:hypothetical protein
MLHTLPRPAPNFLGDEFNKFLFALVGTDQSGAQLSVISALARLDLDAWDEAASLARLPRDAAVNKLSGLLRSNPEIPRISHESRAIAARLIDLLPRGATLQSPPHTARTRWPGASGAAGLGMLIALGVLIGLHFANQAASPQQARADAAHSLPTHSPPLASPPP